MALVKVVTSFPVIKVQLVKHQHEADLLVFVTKTKSEAKGKDEIWFFEDSFPDCKVAFVSSSGDLKVFYVDHAHQAKWAKPHPFQKRIG